MKPLARLTIQRRAFALLPRMSLIVCLVMAWSTNGTSQTPVVRLQTPVVPVDTGLLAALLPGFEQSTGYRVDVEGRGPDLFAVARQGKADLIVSSYGQPDVEAFILEGLGLWPRTMFANQFVLMGPSTDPGGIRGLQDAVEAFRRIAQTRSRFVVNNAETEKHLLQTLWEASGRPDPGDWLIDSGLREQQAVLTAGRMGAYVLWGSFPSLRLKQSGQSALEVFVADDPILQRGFVSIVVNPEKFSGVNIAGAIALQNYLAAPATQAKIRAFRLPGFDHSLFWPTARDNTLPFLADSRIPPAAASEPVATAVSFDSMNIRLGGSFTAVITGTNLSAETYLDIRFRKPGSSTDEVAVNWQQGTSQTHSVNPNTPTGTWTITGLRAHRDSAEHRGSFIPVSGTLTVLP